MTCGIDVQRPSCRTHLRERHGTHLAALVGDQAIRAAGIEKKGGPHTARHTFATILRAKGFSLEEIQAILGHSSRITTEIYAKLIFTPETRDRYLQLFEGGAYKRVVG